MTLIQPWWQDEEKLTERAQSRLFHKLPDLRIFLRQAKILNDWFEIAFWQRVIELKEKESTP